MYIHLFVLIHKTTVKIYCLTSN